MIQNAGTNSIVGNNSAAVGSAGTAIRIFTMHLISGGGGATVVSLKNGSTSGGTTWITETGTTSTGKTFNYGHDGVLFPAGCFVVTDANSADVTITFTY
jgi:hypothetical protein